MVAALLGGLAVSCGSCLEHAAVPVTFKVRNELAWPIYVQDDFGQLGTSVLRREGDGTQVLLRETSPCACEECSTSQSCNLCDCTSPTTLVRRIEPGETLERVWQGEFREEVDLGCEDGRDRGAILRSTCLGDRLAAQPGAYRVRLCYAQSITGAPPGDDRFPAELRGKLTCSTADFEHPAHVVEVSTSNPESCKATRDCPEGQLCQGGRCSADCLPHEVPALGGDWTVEIGGLDDRGFFTVTERKGSKVYEGTGKVTSVRYNRGTTNLELERIGDNGLDFSASLYYVLPEGRAVPITVGETLSITLRMYPDDGPRRLGRGIVLRQAGTLLLAADTGVGGIVLDGYEVPNSKFNVDVEGAAFACNPGDCGRRTHRTTSFFVGPEKQLHVLEAGRTAEVQLEGEKYELIAVGNYADEANGCGAMPVTPYVVMLDRNAQQQ